MANDTMKIDSGEMSELEGRLNKIFTSVNNMGDGFPEKFVTLTNTNLFATGIQKLNAQIISIANSFCMLGRIINVQTGIVFNSEQKLTNDINDVTIPNVGDEGATSSTGSSTSSSTSSSSSGSAGSSSTGSTSSSGGSSTGSSSGSAGGTSGSTGGSSSGGNSGSSGSSGSSNNGGSGSGSSTVPVPEITTLTVSDLAVISDSVLDIANDKSINVGQLLSSSNTAGDLKKALLKCPLSNELLNKIEDMEPKALQQFLKDIYSGNRTNLIKLGNTSLQVIQNHLMELGEGKSLNDLLSNPNNSDAFIGLKSLENVDKYLESLKVRPIDDVKSDLLYVYNGNVNDSGLTPNSVYAIRHLSEAMAQENNVSVETLLTDSRYNDYVQNKINEVEKSFSYMGTLANTTSKNSQEVLSKLIDSKNA